MALTPNIGSYERVREGSKTRAGVALPQRKNSVGFRASSYFAIALAAASWLLEVDKMPEMLPPTPKQRAAVAKATKASSRVYSITS